MQELFFSLLTGFICGAVFGFTRLPIPAPSTLAGVLGIAGIFLGFMAARHLRK